MKCELRVCGRVFISFVTIIKRLSIRITVTNCGFSLLVCSAAAAHDPTNIL